MKREQIICLTNLRSGMTFKSQTSIRLGHSTTIINDLDRCSSSIYYQYLDILSTCINSILYQFLDDRSRTLNNLTCSNLVSYRIGQKLYYIAHKDFPLSFNETFRFWVLSSVPGFFGRQTKISSLEVGRTSSNQ